MGPNAVPHHPWGPTGKRVHEVTPVALAAKLGLPQAGLFQSIDEVAESATVYLREGEAARAMRDRVLRQLADAEFLLHKWAEAHKHKRSSLGDETAAYFKARGE